MCTYRYLVGVMRESLQFLRGTGMVENSVVGHLRGARYSFDEAGNLVRREPDRERLQEAKR